MYAFILSAVIAGTLTGAQAKQNFTDFGQALYAQMTKGGAKFDEVAFEAKLKTKAEEMTKGVDPETVDVKGATDWAFIYDQAGQWDSAVTLLKRYLATKPSGVEGANAKLELANIYVEQKNIKGAEDIALSNDPDMKLTGYGLSSLDQNIAGAYQDQKDISGAVAFLKKAISGLNPTDKGSISMLKGTLSQLTLIGQPAPELTWLPEHYGDFTNISSLKGQVVVLDFFAHWCGPCKASMPEMHNITDEFGPKGLKVVGITAFYGTYNGKKTTQKEEYADMAQFMKEYKIDHPVAYVKNSEMLKYGVTGIPEFVLIGKDGKIKLLQVGYGPGALDAMKKEIASELSK